MSILAGLGMLTPIGHTARSTCAAHRAGIVRTESLMRHGSVREEEEEDALGGCVVRGYTEGFQLFGLWIRLAHGALVDLARNVELPDPSDRAAWQRTALIAALPVLDPDRYGLSLDDGDPAFQSLLLGPLTGLMGWPLPPEQRFAVQLGHCSGAMALAWGRSLLDDRRADRVIVVGVDSTADAQSLPWLASSGSLKSRENPTGAIPGEGAAALLLQSQPAPAETEATARIVGEAVRYDADYPERDPVALSRDWVVMIRSAFAGRPSAAPFRGDLYVDLNGEVWRAMAWGHAQVALQDVIDFEHCRMIPPATSFGETGAASACLALGLAARAFVRGYAGGPEALVCSLSDYGDTAAIVLQEPS